VIENHHRQSRIGVGVGEAREPALGGRILLGNREHALRRQVVNDVEVVVDHLDQAEIGFDD
jgi:hypothetical protein